MELDDAVDLDLALDEAESIAEEASRVYGLPQSLSNERSRRASAPPLPGAPPMRAMPPMQPMQPMPVMPASLLIRAG